MMIKKFIFLVTVAYLINNAVTKPTNETVKKLTYTTSKYDLSQYATPNIYNNEHTYYDQIPYNNYNKNIRRFNLNTADLLKSVDNGMEPYNEPGFKYDQKKETEAQTYSYVDLKRYSENSYNSAPNNYYKPPTGYNSVPSSYNNAQSSYNSASNNYNKAYNNPNPSKYDLSKYIVPNNYFKPATSYNSAQSSYNNVPSSYNNAQSSYNNAQSSYNNVPSSYNNAQSSYNNAQSSYNSASNNYNKAYNNPNPSKYDLSKYAAPKNYN